jgi:exosome complex component CSL4
VRPSSPSRTSHDATDASACTLGSDSLSTPFSLQVIGHITRLTPQQATLAITVVGNQPTPEEFQGVVRVQDVRLTEKDKVKIADSFRLGDVVRAVVVRRLVDRR